MTCVLFSHWLTDDFAFVEALRSYISADSRVLMLPFAHPVDCDRARYEQKYAIGGAHHRSAVEAFAAWGVPADHIQVANAFDDDRSTILDKLATSDILLFTGGMPDIAVERLDALGLRTAISAFPGLVMGYSAGALLQMTDYFLSPDRRFATLICKQGLGLVSADFQIKVHYTPDPETDALLAAIAADTARPVYALTDHGAILVEADGRFSCIGKVIAFEPPVGF